MIMVSQKLRIAYLPIPKIGSTSLKKWIFELAFNEPFIMPVHKGIAKVLRKRKHTALFLAHHLVDVPEDYFCFCVLREPTDRFLSGYKNRILKKGELSASRPYMRSLLEQGLVGDPDPSYFAINLKEYMQVPTIKHHFSPMTSLVGAGKNRYAYYSLKNLKQLHADLASHLASIKYRNFSEVIDSSKLLAPLPMKNSSEGGEQPIKLTREAYREIQQFYSEDFELWRGSGLGENL